jgi:hypothetical protein
MEKQKNDFTTIARTFFDILDIYLSPEQIRYWGRDEDAFKNTLLAANVSIIGEEIMSAPINEEPQDITTHIMGTGCFTWRNYLEEWIENKFPAELPAVGKGTAYSYPLNYYASFDEISEHLGGNEIIENHLFGLQHIKTLVRNQNSSNKKGILNFIGFNYFFARDVKGKISAMGLWWHASPNKNSSQGRWKYHHFPEGKLIKGTLLLFVAQKALS